MHDADQLCAICGREGFTFPYIHRNPDSMHMPLRDRILALARLGREVAAGKHGKSLLYAIRPRQEQGRLAGITALDPLDPQSPLFKGADARKEWEIAYCVDPEYQGRGVATEAIHYTVQHAISNGWSLEGLWAAVEPSRAASIAVAKKLGLRLVEEIPADTGRTFYLDDDGKPAARNIYRTPPGWSLPALELPA